MKQNSSILFHPMRKSLKNRYFRSFFAVILAVDFFIAIRSEASTEVVQPVSHPAHFDPAKGFRPAQTDLTKIFLQIAGSLEYEGSPVPYLLHMKREHARIEAEYTRRTGKVLLSLCPSHMDDDYISQVSASWDKLTPNLGLMPMTKHIGALMTKAIQGTQGTGTILVDVFNQHQSSVFSAMAGKKNSVGFNDLQSQLIDRLELNKTGVNEAAYELPRRDAVSSALSIKEDLTKLFQKLYTALSVDDARRIETALTTIIIDIGKMANSELEGGIIEQSLNVAGQSETKKAAVNYSADQETALSGTERKTFAYFLRKDRFTKTDFKLLEEFYSGAYDKLSERGKDEMQHRVWQGMRGKK